MSFNNNNENIQHHHHQETYLMKWKWKCVLDEYYFWARFSIRLSSVSSLLVVCAHFFSLSLFYCRYLSCQLTRYHRIPSPSMLNAKVSLSSQHEHEHAFNILIDTKTYTFIHIQWNRICEYFSRHDTHTHTYTYAKILRVNIFKVVFIMIFNLITAYYIHQEQPVVVRVWKVNLPCYALHFVFCNGWWSVS